MKHVYLYFTIFLLVPFSIKAQWAYVGSGGFSPNVALYTTLAMDRSGTPFLAYSDTANAFKAAVKKYTGTSWTLVGTAGISNGKAQYISMVIDTAGKPLVAFGDSGIAGKLYVVKYTGTNWTNVGNLNTGAICQSTAITVDSKNNIYAAYNDTRNNNRAISMRFAAGAWTILDTTPGPAYFLSFTVNKTTDSVYLGYEDGAVGGRASLRNIKSHRFVGVQGFTNNVTNYNTTAIDHAGNFYMAYNDSTLGGAAAMMYNGSSWTQMGSANFSNGNARFTSITLTKQDSVIVGYSGPDSFATVMKFDGLNWAPLGTTGFSGLTVSYVSMACDTFGNPYIGFEDDWYGSRASVLKYMCARPPVPQLLVSDPVVCAGNQSILRIASGSQFAGIHWEWYKGSCNGTLVDTGTVIYVNPDTSTTYYVVGTGWCKTQDTCASTRIVVDTISTPSVTISADTNNVCYGTRITFTATPVNGGPSPIYQWKKNNHGLNAYGQHYVDSTLQNGDTIQCIMFPDGCSSLFLVASNIIINTINTITLPVITADGPLVFCHNDSVKLTVNAGNTRYHWSTGDSTLSITVHNTGTYSVTATTGVCSYSSSVSATAATTTLKPNITYTGQLIICNGGHVMLDAGIGYDKYRWSSGDSTQIIYADTTADYIVTVTQGTCTGKDTVSVLDTVMTLTVLIQPFGGAFACIGDTALLDAGIGFDTYHWSNGDTTRYLHATSNGNFNVTVTTNGCIGVDSSSAYFSTTPPPVIVSFDSILVVCSNRNITLHTTQMYDSYTWSNGAHGSIIVVTDSGTYNITVTSSGCSATNSAPVTVTNFHYIPFALDTVATDSAGVTLAKVVPPNPGAAYLWEANRPNISHHSNSDSLSIYCYLPARSYDWTIMADSIDSIRVIISYNGCSDTLPWTTVRCEQLINDIETVGSISTFSLQPNPATDVLHVTYSLSANAQMQLSVFDIEGRRLKWTEEENQLPGDHKADVDIKYLVSGIYILNLNDGKRSSNIRFVKL